MAADFYYLLSSLPTLRREVAPPLTSAELLELCESQLGEARYRELAGLGPVPRTDPCCPLERRWNAFETALRNQLARQRAGAARQDLHEALRDEQEAYGDLDTMVSEALAGAHPLAREQALLALRWRHLSDLEAAHQFDFEALVAYRLKLLLLEQFHARSAEAGRGALDRFLEARMETVKIAELGYAS